MSLISRFRSCSRCLRPERTVYGSQQWHARNDPPGGYCHCADEDLLTRLLPKEPARPADAVTCATCEGRKVVGIPGADCPMCKGTGWDKLATEARRLNALSPDDEAA